MKITEDEIKKELQNVHEDLVAFQEAYDRIIQRLLALESDPARYERLASWAGTQTVLNALRMVIVRCEGLMEDYLSALANITDKNLN